MLLQQSPFRGEDEDEIYDAILADEPLYPIHMPRDSVSILQKLLTREPELRLGSGPTDAQEIMSHAFFRNVNWEDVENKGVPPPFQPAISNPTDTSNFDSEFTSVTPVLTPVQSGKLDCKHKQNAVTDRLCSLDASDARGVSWLLLFCRLHMSAYYPASVGLGLTRASAPAQRETAQHACHDNGGGVGGQRPSSASISRRVRWGGWDIGEG